MYSLSLTELFLCYSFYRKHMPKKKQQTNGIFLAATVKMFVML